MKISIYIKKVQEFRVIKWFLKRVTKCLIHYSAIRLEGHVALDRNLGPGYDTLMIDPGGLLSPRRQFHTLPGLFDIRASLSNPFPKTLRTMQGASCTIFMMVFGITRPGGELTTYCEADTLTTKPTRHDVKKFKTYVKFIHLRCVVFCLLNYLHYDLGNNLC